MVALLAAAVAAAVVVSAPAAGGAAPVCRASQLRGHLLGTSGAAGTIVLSITLRNRAGPCSLKGYADLRLRKGNHLLPTHVLHGGLPVLGQKPVRVLLARGGAATVLVAYSDVPTGYETSCPESTALLVKPPGQAHWLTVAARAQACNRGTLRESPVLLGVRRAP